MYVFVDFLEVSWLPGRPGGPGKPSESSGGSEELPGSVLGPFGAAWGGPWEASNHHF